MTFIEQLETDIIPRIKEMIKKEEEHEAWLYKKWKSYDNVTDEIFDFFYNATTVSYNYLQHYKQRLMEYTEYLERQKASEFVR